MDKLYIAISKEHYAGRVIHFTAIPTLNINSASFYPERMMSQEEFEDNLNEGGENKYSIGETIPALFIFRTGDGLPRFIMGDEALKIYRWFHKHAIHADNPTVMQIAF